MAIEDIQIAPLTFSLCGRVSDLMAEVISDLSYYSVAARQSEISKYTAAKLQELIRNDPPSVLVAKTGDELVGFCVSTYDDGVIWLAWFGVAKRQRGKGIGALLVNAAIELVRTRGCHKIWCDSRTSNAASRSVLLDAGFREICLLERHWYGQDFWLWEKFV